MEVDYFSGLSWVRRLALGWRLNACTTVVRTHRKTSDADSKLPPIKTSVPGSDADSWAIIAMVKASDCPEKHVNKPFVFNDKEK